MENDPYRTQAMVRDFTVRPTPLIEKLHAVDMKTTRRDRMFELMATRAMREGRDWTIIRCEPHECRKSVFNGYGNRYEWPEISAFMSFLVQEGFRVERRKSERICWSSELHISWKKLSK